ncbi:MAG: ATP-binding cassette domain-containing protein [Gemmobacter sp.]
MVIALQGVEVRRGGRAILGPLTLALADAGLTMVMGPNGSGKTTFLRALHGLERIARGQVVWPGGDPDRGTQAFVFQQPVLMRRSVRDCIAYPLRLRGVGLRAARARAEAAGAEAGLADRLGVEAQALSGGERQKMALARALIAGPRLLFLDEPSASLDGTSTREIEAVLARVRDSGTRIVMATHDIGQARRLADDVVFLHRGRVVEAAARAAFFDAPQTPEVQGWLRGDLLA